MYAPTSQKTSLYLVDKHLTGRPVWSLPTTDLEANPIDGRASIPLQLNDEHAKLLKDFQV